MRLGVGADGHQSDDQDTWTVHLRKVKSEPKLKARFDVPGALAAYLRLFLSPSK
jgi:hypothetical protein